MGLPQPNCKRRSFSIPLSTTKVEAYLPAGTPPYETPLDLRFPLHWDVNFQFEPLYETHVGIIEEAKPGSLSKVYEAARDGVWIVGVSLELGTATRMWHHLDVSPPYFQVDFNMVDKRTWSDVHDKVMEMIQRHFGGLEQYRNAVVRYTDYPKDEDLAVWD